MLIGGCTYQGYLKSSQRSILEVKFNHHAQTLCSVSQPLDSKASSSKGNTSSASTVITSTLDLVKTAYRPFQDLTSRMGSFSNLKELKEVGVPRFGHGKVGDLVLFHPLSTSAHSWASNNKIKALEIAIVTRILGHQFYEICAFYRSQPIYLRLHLGYPHSRRYQEHVLNSYIRTVHAHDGVNTAYLAGERFMEFRAFF